MVFIVVCSLIGICIVVYLLIRKEQEEREAIRVSEVAKQRLTALSNENGSNYVAEVPPKASEKNMHNKKYTKNQRDWQDKGYPRVVITRYENGKVDLVQEGNVVELSPQIARWTYQFIGSSGGYKD